MLPRFVAAVCGLGLASLGGCGGSSSETPPPLEPDLRIPEPASSAKPASPPKPKPEAAAAEEQTPEHAEAPEPDPPTTWGTNGGGDVSPQPARSAAPALRLR